MSEIGLECTFLQLPLYYENFFNTPWCMLSACSVGDESKEGFRVGLQISLPIQRQNTGALTR